MASTQSFKGTIHNRWRAIHWLFSRSDLESMLEKQKRFCAVFSSRWIFIVACMLLTGNAIAEDVYITGGDSDALQTAILAASAPGADVTIHLQAGQIFEDVPTFGVFHGNLKIEGNGAVFGRANVERGIGLGLIDVDGAVTITGVTYINYESGPGSCALIKNRGNLSLERVTFSNSVIETNGNLIQCSTRPPFSEELLLNEGSAELFNVTITGTRISAFQGSVIRSLDGASTRIAHLTVVDPPLDTSQGVILSASAKGPISVSNSIILSDGNTEGKLVPCAGPIIDNGGNFASAGDCGFSGGLIDRSSLKSSVEKGHDAWVVPLLAGSVAIGAGNPDFCAKLDGRGFERGAACDSGAYEANASSHGGELGRGGISGIYCTPDTDGNYVQLQRAFDGNVVIIWNTFDTAGAQAWVFGLGSDQDGVVAAPAYRNLGGVLQPGAGASTATVTDWGTLKVTVHDCLNITLKYDSTDPDFGTGTFDAQRLAFVHDLGCSE